MHYKHSGASSTQADSAAYSYPQQEESTKHHIIEYYSDTEESESISTRHSSKGTQSTANSILVITESSSSSSMKLASTDVSCTYKVTEVSPKSPSKDDAVEKDRKIEEFSSESPSKSLESHSPSKRKQSAPDKYGSVKKRRSSECSELNMDCNHETDQYV